MTDHLTDLDLYVAGSDTPCARLTADGGVVALDGRQVHHIVFADIERLREVVSQGPAVCSSRLWIFPFRDAHLPTGPSDA